MKKGLIILFLLCAGFAFGKTRYIDYNSDTIGSMYNCDTVEDVEKLCKIGDLEFFYYKTIEDVEREPFEGYLVYFLRENEENIYVIVHRYIGKNKYKIYVVK